MGLTGDSSDVATVADLIEHLEKNFDPDDMLCFFYEGGARCELEHAPSDLIGDPRWFFVYAKDRLDAEMAEISRSDSDGKLDPARRENLKARADVVRECYDGVGDCVLVY